MLPQAKAFALGIVPSSTGDYTLADGSTVTNYLGTATVTIRPPANLPADLPPAALQPETVTGVVVLCGNGALVGMEFLRILDKYLLVGPIVTLIDVSLVNATVQQAAAASLPQPPQP